MAEQAASLRVGHWRCGPGKTIALDRARVMAVLNVTPDSFSDGGELTDPGRAVAAALAAIEEGAAILDVGGESTRPGAQPVPDDEQIRRVVPAVEAIRAAAPEIPLSVDTTRSAVARAALDAGADAVNDTSAGCDDPALLELVAQRGAGLVLMHRLCAPNEDRWSHERDRDPPAYEGGVVEAVARFLTQRAACARRVGLGAEAIALDPGLGFGKSVEQNLQLLAATTRLAQLGHPLLVGPSRKSFLGAVTGQAEPRRRDFATLGALAVARLRGAHIFRTHNVAAAVQTLRVVDAVLAADRCEGP